MGPLSGVKKNPLRLGREPSPAPPLNMGAAQRNEARPQNALLGYPRRDPLLLRSSEVQRPATRSSRRPPRPGPPDFQGRLAGQHEGPQVPTACAGGKEADAAFTCAFTASGGGGTGQGQLTTAGRPHNRLGERETTAREQRFVAHRRNRKSLPVRKLGVEGG